MTLADRPADRPDVDDLFPLVYDELRAIARRLRPGDTLGPTAIVHEAYLRFAGRSAPDLVDRDHFVALAARAMRMVVVDHWRRRHARKRDPQAPVTVNVEDVAAPEPPPALDLLALDAALLELKTLDPRQARIVELRFFGGLTLAEIGAMLALSDRTVKREWQKARAFLYQAMRASGAASDD